MIIFVFLKLFLEYIHIIDMPAINYTDPVPESLHFVLEAFESNVTIDLCGNLFSETPLALDTSAVAVIYVPTQAMKDTFKFMTDATDVINLESSDIRYYVDSEAWPGIDVIQPANAMLDKPDDGSARPIASADGTNAYIDKKMMVCHDFTRYLAQQLFNTHLGVDLFNNEKELLNSIRVACDDSAAGHTYYDVLEVLKNVDLTGSGANAHADLVSDADGNYMTNSTASDSVANKTNICRVLFNQMMDVSGVHRFADILSGITQQPDNQDLAPNTDPTSVRQSLPFLENDTISFKLIINPAEGQNDLTGVEPFGARSYEIRLVLKDDITGLNTEVDTEEL